MFKNMNLSKLVIVISLYFILILTISNKVFSFYVVSGNSMLPNVHDKEVKSVNKMVKKYKRGDIVIVKNNRDQYLMIKRIIGLPGEKLDVIYDDVYINDKKLDEPYVNQSDEKSDFYIRNIRLKENEYYVMGDNRNYSIDSRELGPLKKSDIIGRCK